MRLARVVRTQTVANYQANQELDRCEHTLHRTSPSRP